MRRNALTPAIVALLAVCAGCGKDYNARSILTHSRWPGTAQLALAGPPEKLIKDYKIDAHRRYTMSDKTTEIDVWIIKARPPKGQQPPKKVLARGTVVILHGLSDSKARYLGLGRRLADNGFDVVLPDLRAHGKSTGQFTTYGAWERVDVKRVVDKLIAEKVVSRRVYVFGVSLGGSVAIQYAAIESKCRGVAAVAPFKDAYSITRRRLLLLSQEDFEQTLARAGELANFTPDGASALKAAGVLSCPLLIIHGRLDTVVPYDHGRAIYEAAKDPKRMLTVAWAGHGSILMGREGWFVARIEELDQIARKYDSAKAKPAPPEPPVHKPAVIKRPPPKAPPPKVPTIKPPPVKKPPATKPAPKKPPVVTVPVPKPPTTRPATTKPATTKPAPKKPPVMTIPIPKPPVKKPAAKLPVARPPGIGLLAPPKATTRPATGPTTRPATKSIKPAL